MVVRSRLEFEGIECFVKDELTIQVDNFYSNAIGGLELQVKGEDFETAIIVLKELGHSVDGVKTKRQSVLEKLTENIPIINQLPLSFRVLVLLPIILVPLTLYLQKETQPSLDSLLINTNWCVHTITFDGISRSFNELPESAIYSPYQECEVQMRIDDKYHIFLPIEFPNQIKGHIHLRNDSLEIFGLDTLQDKYNHVYKVDVTESRLTLTSSKTRIWCTKSAMFNSWMLN